MEEIISIEQNRYIKSHRNDPSDLSLLQKDIQRIIAKKERAYNDYAEEILSKEEYLTYRKKYEAQISSVKEHIKTVTMSDRFHTDNIEDSWITQLLNQHHIDQLNRSIIVEMIYQISVYENKTLKIVYNFSNKEDLPD